MSEERMTLTVGQPFGSTPPNEGYMPVINGSSFDIIAFFSGISETDLRDWLKGELQYGVYIENSIPIVILDIGRTWSLDVFLNIFREEEEIRRQFFEGDLQNTKMHLTLVSLEMPFSRESEPSPLIRPSWPISRRPVFISPRFMQPMRTARRRQKDCWPGRVAEI